MNIKKDLKDMGLFMITPMPAKYHFEGVDNRRAARNVTIVALTIQFGTIAVMLFGPKVMNELDALKTKFKNRKK